MVRKLELEGRIRGRGQTVSSYHSWPMGQYQAEVEKIIAAFKIAFEPTWIYIEHVLNDDYYNY